jgi:KipI family sensor histidine kinase inhibitor
MRLQVVGEDALMVYVSDNADSQTSALVQTAVAALEHELAGDLVDLVPSYASILVLFNPLRVDHFSVARRARNVLKNIALQPPFEGRTVTLPVHYSAETGADLQALADRANLTVDEVINLHSETEYRVFAIGFAPGFAYLGQVDERIAAPRLATPRALVPRGSVAIADRQTAVYPADSPGGWNLIGRCPVTMFNPDAQPVMPVCVGDKVCFEPVDRNRFLSLGGELT